MVLEGGYDWIYGDLVGIVFRYNERTGTVQRLYEYEPGWETMPEREPSDTYVKEIKEQQDLTQSSFYTLFGVQSSYDREATGWFTMPGDPDSIEAAPVKLKLIKREGVSVEQMRALSTLEQPVNVLGGSSLGDWIFVATLSGKVYHIEEDGGTRRCGWGWSEGE